MIPKLFTAVVKPFLGSGIGRNRGLAGLCNSIATLLYKGKIVHLDGFDMDMGDKIDYVSLSILIKKEYEPAITSIFRKLLREGDCVVDVGANIGYFTLFSAYLVGKTGRVYAFEPNIENMYTLEHNIQLNNFSWVSTINEALGNYQGEGVFHISGNNWAGSLVKTKEHSGDVLVNVNKLDNYSFPKNIRLLKIDTDGNDLEVLKGAEKLIRGKVDAFVCEVYPDGLEASGSSVTEMWEYVESFGMENYIVDNDTILPCNSVPQTKKQSVNLFCVKETAWR